MHVRSGAAGSSCVLRRVSIMQDANSKRNDTSANALKACSLACRVLSNLQMRLELSRPKMLFMVDCLLGKQYRSFLLRQSSLMPLSELLEFTVMCASSLRLGLILMFTGLSVHDSLSDTASIFIDMGIQLNHVPAPNLADVTSQLLMSRNGCPSSS